MRIRDRRASRDRAVAGSTKLHTVISTSKRGCCTAKQGEQDLRDLPSGPPTEGQRSESGGPTEQKNKLPPLRRGRLGRPLAGDQHLGGEEEQRQEQEEIPDLGPGPLGAEHLRDVFVLSRSHCPDGGPGRLLKR